MALLIGATPMEKRAMAIRIWSATAALAAAVGPSLEDCLSRRRRWVFLVNLPVGVIALIGAARVGAESRDAGARPADLVGRRADRARHRRLARAREGNTWGWSVDHDATLAFVVVGLRRSGFVPATSVTGRERRCSAFGHSRGRTLRSSRSRRFRSESTANILWMQSMEFLAAPDWSRHRARTVDGARLQHDRAARQSQCR
jgi:hypothetical protein